MSTQTLGHIVQFEGGSRTFTPALMISSKLPGLRPQTLAVGPISTTDLMTDVNVTKPDPLNRIWHDSAE